jgi:hypothetical protein
MLYPLIATTETTGTPDADIGVPTTWLGWVILAVMVGLFFLIQRTRQRHIRSRHDREAQLRRSDPDLRRD